MTPIRIFAISGSLRKASINSALLRIASTLLPENVELEIYQGLDQLPHFNPDMEGREAASVLGLESNC